MIPEADWKLLRALKPVALNRFCRRALDEFASLANVPSEENSHERYLHLFQRVQERDRELASAFDDLRRSSAVDQLARMYQLALITDEELARFSTDTQAAISRRIT